MIDGSKSSTARQAPRWARAVGRVVTHLTTDLFGGPRPVTMAWAINLHKGSTLLVVALLMAWYGTGSAAAWTYLALHGSYGLCWMLKHFAFRDERWEARVTVGGAAATFLFLGTYWIAPYLLISGALGAGDPARPAWSIGSSILLYVLGVAVMIAADCQKHFTLRYGRRLIREGMFRHVRHPNYLGEMMLYAAFALLVGHWLPWLVLALWWSLVFLPNMLRIEASLSRYAEWEDYRARTGMLLPWRILSPR